MRFKRFTLQSLFLKVEAISARSNQPDSWPQAACGRKVRTLIRLPAEEACYPGFVCTTTSEQPMFEIIEKL